MIMKGFSNTVVWRVRVGVVSQGEGETAEQVERKGIKVFNDAGVDVSVTDIAVAHHR